MGNEIDRVLDPVWGRLEIKIGETVRPPNPAAPEGPDEVLKSFLRIKSQFGINTLCESTGKYISIFALIKK